MNPPGRKGRVASINVSAKKGQIKKTVPRVELVKGKGLMGDGHFAFGRRQVSLLMLESIKAQKKRLEKRGLASCGEAAGRGLELGPGVFAENFTTEGLDLGNVKIGDLFLVGGKIRLRVSQIGKECHTRCEVFKQVGDCIMPGLGIFCEVLDDGIVNVGDEIKKVAADPEECASGKGSV
jgi:MOSC domain-containing protein YiiM